ncbi:hypothetical protein NC651_032911 [Populus alba x Populus x berolinensis]|nr:hypothetical protein NC651_032911 [Populus alba x Populus x berolinensis]
MVALLQTTKRERNKRDGGYYYSLILYVLVFLFLSISLRSNSFPTSSIVLVFLSCSALFFFFLPFFFLYCFLSYLLSLPTVFLPPLFYSFPLVVSVFSPLLHCLSLALISKGKPCGSNGCLVIWR